MVGSVGTPSARCCRDTDGACHVAGRGGRLLPGGRRAPPPANPNDLARVIARMGDLALPRGDRWKPLEITPLRAEGTIAKAPDAAAPRRGDAYPPRRAAGSAR